MLLCMQLQSNLNRYKNIENVLQYLQPSYSVKWEIWFGEGIEKEIKMKKKKTPSLNKPQSFALQAIES